MMMFFKFRKTQVEDDFDDLDNFDDWDDFGLEDSGFNDTTPKSKTREAVTAIKGGFFSGLKDAIFSPNNHKKILQAALPEGYAAHYDDARDALKQTKGLYDTVKKEGQDTHEAFRKEVAPHLLKYNEKKQTKLSRKLAKYAEKARREVPTNVISEEEMAYTSAANEIFGTALNRQQNEMLGTMAVQGEESSKISQAMQQQTNELLLNTSNSLQRQNAFNDQVAMRWQRKMLELKYKQYFTARKQLEITTQQSEYLQATLPNIVKNTGLPDAVKITLTEQGTQMFKERFIGGLQNHGRETMMGVFGGVIDKTKNKVTEQLKQITDQISGGALSSGLNMFGDDEFSMSPTQFAGNAVGGMLSDFIINKIIKSSEETLRQTADSSTVNFEDINERLNMLREVVPGMFKRGIEQGFGNDKVDGFFNRIGADDIVNSRNKKIQSSLVSELDQQALFDLETKKSITMVIPNLLSEIHGEIYAVRNGMGFESMDKDNRLRVDWETGTLNTHGNLREKLVNKLADPSRKSMNDDITYDMFEKMGFDNTSLIETGELTDEQGNVLLDKKAVTELAKAMKTKSFDPNEVFDIVEFAQGSKLIKDKKANKAIQKFFRETLGVNENQRLLTEGTSVMESLKERAMNSTTEQNKHHAIMAKALGLYNQAGIKEDVYTNAAKMGQTDILLEEGAVGLENDGSVNFNPSADSEFMYSGAFKLKDGKSLYHGKVNNKYGAQDAADKAFTQKLMDRSRKKRDKKLLAKENKAWSDYLKTLSFTEKTKAELGKKTNSDGYKQWRVDNGFAKSLEDQTSPLIGTGEYRIAPVVSRVNENIFTEQSPINPNWRPGTQAPTPPTPTPPTPPVPPTPPTNDAETGNLSSFISEKVKSFLDSVLTRFTPDDFVNMADGIKKGLQNFLTVLADRGVPLTNQEIAARAAQNLDSTGLTDEAIQTLTNNFATATGYAMANLLRSLRGGSTGQSDSGNFYYGGTVPHFRRGGKVKSSRKNKSYIRDIKKAVDDAMGNTAAKQIFTPAMQTGLLSPIQKAVEKEKALGGDPQVVVASAGEEILSTQNGDAQFFRKLKQEGIWNTLKSAKNDVLAERENDGEWQGLFRELGRETEKSAAKYSGKVKQTASQAIQGKGHSMALMLHDIRNDAGKELIGPTMPFVGPMRPDINRDDINLPDEVKAAAKAVYNKLMAVTDGKKELVEKYWNDISAKLPEGAKPELIKARLEERLKNLNEGKFGVISNQVKKLKGALNIEGLAKGEDGKRDISGWAKGRATTAKDKVKNAYNEFDKEAFKQNATDKFNNAKDFTKNKFNSAKGVFYDEDGNPLFSLPTGFSLPGSNTSQLDAIATITRQMAELIRTNAFIAVNTGTSQSEASPVDAEGIKPYSVPGKKPVANVKGKLSKLFGNVKSKFNKEPALDENGNPVETAGRLSKFKSWAKAKMGGNQNFVGPQQPKYSRIVGGKLKFIVDKGKGFIQRNKDKEKNQGKYFDVFIKGQKKPVISAMSFHLGNYIDLTSGNVVKTPEDITGPVASLAGRVVITQEDFNNGIIIKKATNLGALKDIWNRKRGLTQAGKVDVSKPMLLARLFRTNKDNSSDKKSKKVKVQKGKISWNYDLYLKGSNTPVITGNGLRDNVYLDPNTKKPIITYRMIKALVVDKDGKIILRNEQLSNGYELKPNGNNYTATDIQEQEGKTKKRGLLRRMASVPFKLAFGTIKGAGNIGHWTGKKLFGYNMVEDIYVLGETEPRLLAKDMKAGKYYCKDKKGNKKVIKSFEDITGAVYNEDDNIVVTSLEVADKKLMTKSGKKKKSIAGMLVSGIGTMMGRSFGLGTKMITAPFKWLFGHRSKGVGEKSGFITFDIYVNDPEDKKVRILSKKVPDNFYVNKEKVPVLKYDQLGAPVYDKDGNLVITEEDIKKGLVTPNGTPISKLGGGLFKTVKLGIGMGMGFARGLLNIGKAIRTVAMAPFKIVGGLWKGLKGFGGLMSDAVTKMLGMRGFDVDGRNKDALMIQAQAMAVDKLEMIRTLLDQRLAKPKKRNSNDTDGDGVRDGSYLDQLRKKARGEDKKKKRDEAKADKDKKKDEKDKDEKSSLFSSLILKALIGGTIGGLFGPKIISGLTMTMRNILPSWLGGYSEEQKNNIEKNGGIFGSVMKDIDPNTGEAKSKAKADPNNPNAKVEEEEGGFSWKGAALGAGALMFPRLAMKIAGAPFSALRMGSNAIGLTNKLGIAGLGKRAAAKSLAQGAGRFLLGRVLTSAATAGTAGASTGIMASLASNPVGWTIAGVIGVGLLAYGGYKAYKWFTSKKENQLARWRMAQYGYKLSDETHAVKVLDLEDYLSKYTTRSSKSTPARITDQANFDEALKIFRVNPNSGRDVESFKTWFFYRFKPVYISWKTATQNITGTDDISKLDDMLLKTDKIRLVTDTHFSNPDKNPYSYQESPFAGESSVKLDMEEVHDIRRTILSSLEDIDEEEHDARIVRNGGGKNKTKSDSEQSSDYKANTAAGAAAKANSRFNGGGITSGNTNQDSKNTTEAKSGQSWWNKLINGDNATDEGRGMSLGDKVSNMLGDLFFGSGKVAAGTTEFAKNFTKGLRIGSLTEAQTAAMAANTADTESEFRLGIINKYGYAGLYQFGGQALADIGFMKKVGGDWRQYNAAMKNPSNWNNGLSLEKFLSSRALQDQAYVALANKNVQYGRSAAGGDAGKFEGMVQDYRLMAKYIKMAHLKGPGNAVKGLLYGRDAKDGNQTSMISYGNGAAANVEAILKQMGGATPNGNPDTNVKTTTKTGNPVYDASASAGAAVRSKLQKMMGTDKPLPAPNPAAKPSPVTTGYDARGMGIMGGLTAKQMANKTSAPPAAIAKPTPTGKPSGSTSGFDARGMGIMGGLTAKQMTGKDKPVTPPKPTKAVPTYTTADGKFSMVPTAGSKVNTTPAKNATPNLVKKAMAGTDIVPLDNSFSVPTAGSAGNGVKAVWMDIAKSYIGTNERDHANMVRSFHKDAPGGIAAAPATPWCASFVRYVLNKAGISVEGTSARAFSFDDYGTDVSSTIPYGAIITWKFSHVSFCAGVEGDKILSLGGNQSSKKGGSQRSGGEVTISRIPRTQIKSVRYPTGQTPGTGQDIGSTLTTPASGPKVTTPKMIQALQRTETKKGGGWEYDESKLFAKGNSVNTTRPLTVKPSVTKTPPKQLTLADSMGIKVKPTKISTVDTVSEYGADTNNPNTEVTDKPNEGNSVTPVTTKSSDINTDTLEESSAGNSVIKPTAETSNEITKAIDKDAQIAKVTQKTIKALEVQKQNNINDAKAQQLQQEKKQQLAQTNHSVLKEQLRLQTLMQADISSMNKLLKDIRDLAAANAKGTTVNTSTNTPVPEAHKRMRIKDTPEPISMKVN